MSSNNTLPITQALDLLDSATTYWVCTTWPGGRPHANLVWGIWAGDTFYFGGSPQARWVRNIRANPAVLVHAQFGDSIVIVEGKAREVQQLAPELAHLLADKSATKYGMRPDPDNMVQEGFFELKGEVIKGWREVTASTGDLY